VTNEEKPLTRWTIPYTSITIEKVKDGPRASEFLITAETVDKLHASPGAHGAAAGTARSAQTGRPVGVEAVAPDRARTSQLSPLSPVDRIGRQDEDMTFKYTEGRKGTPSNRQYPVKLSRCAEEAADPSRSRGHRPPPPCAGIDSDQCWCPKLK
jgi:hypothetical protein